MSVWMNPPSPSHRPIPTLAAGACAGVALLDIAAGTLPRPGPGHRPHTPAALTGVLPDALAPFAAALALGTGVLLLLLARGLLRRKHRTWQAAVTALPAGAAAQFAHRPSLLGVLASLALLAFLLRHRGEFAAPPDPRSRWRALANFILMGTGSILLGLAVVCVHSGSMVGAPSLADRLAHVLYGLSGFRGPVAYTGDASRTVGLSLGTLGLLTAVTSLSPALRPDRHPAMRPAPGDEARLRALLEEHGGRGDPRRLVLRRGEAVVFSPSGKAAVTYRVVHGVMLAGGDPIGDAEAWPGAIERFMDEARARSCIPAVSSCSPTGAEVWTREAGLDVPATRSRRTGPTAGA